ncbi:MAG: hypothetical protein ACFFCH_07930 [Promethearchaeota archaeon]
MGYADYSIDNIEIDDSAGTTTYTKGTGTPTPPGIPGFPFAAIGLRLLIPVALVPLNPRRNAGTME